MAKRHRVDPINDTIDLMLYLVRMIQIMVLIFLVAIPVGITALVIYLVSTFW